MPKLKIDFIQVGMVVAGDVKNLDNMLLIPAGCTLSERQIHILNAWGVAEVDVALAEGADEAGPLAKVPADELEKMTVEIKDRFWTVDESSPVFMEIFKLALERRLQSGLKELVTA